MIKVTRRAKFCASHRLYNPKWSDEKNREVFGLCANPHGHGHNYIVDVTVAGTPDEKTGYIINLVDLCRIIDELIVRPCDHQHLNLQVPFLEGVNPSVENLAERFFHRLSPKIEEVASGFLYSVKVAETENNWAEFTHE